MNICLVSQEYPPETNWGGIATYTQVLARQLVAMGHRVHVVALAEGEEYLADDLGVVVHRVSRSPKTAFEASSVVELAGVQHGILNFAWRVYEEVREIHDQEPLDIVEAPETCAQALFVFKLLKGIKSVTRCHTPFFWVRHLNAMEETPDHLTRDALEKLQAQWSTAVTAPTHAMAQVVEEKWGITGIDVIPNFFSLKRYAPDLSIYADKLSGADYLLFFGRLEYRKGVHVLAQALPEVLERHRELKAVFVGSDSVYNAGSMKSYVEQELDHYRDRLLFIENIPHAALYPIIERASIVVLPSLWENFPYACIEAMALGKAVIASDSGGFAEIIDDGKEGVLAPPGDVTGLRSAIVDTLDRADLQGLGEKARAKAARFDTARIATEMADYYRNLAAAPQARSCRRIGYVLRHIPVPSETFVINEIIAMQSLGFEIYPVSLLPAQKCHETLMARVQKPVRDLSTADSTAGAEESPYYAEAKALADKYRLPASLAAQGALTAAYAIDNGMGLLHAHFATESAWVALIASKVSGIPFSFTAHAYDLFMRDRKVIDEEGPEERLRTLLAHCARCITISDYNSKYILDCCRHRDAEKLAIVRCGIDPERFRPVVRAQKECTTFLSVGRFVEKKGFEYLIRSFALVAGELEEVRLRLIGEGYLRESVAGLVRKLGLEEKVDFLGAVSSDVVLKEMQDAEVFVLHSITGPNGDREGVPVSLMEAAATGMPVVSTRHSGIPELVIDGVTGFLSEEKDVEGFANYMIALAASAQLRKRMGLKGHQLVSRQFNQRLEARKLAGEFSALLAPAASQTAGADAVDIIMPTYRPDLALLKRALQSSIAQTHRNWKLYLVQDGEECDLTPLLRELNDDRIRYWATPHQGKSAALNFALRQGTARYVAYLDDDDIWYPDHLEAAIDQMSKNGVKLLHTDAHEIDITMDGDDLIETGRRPLNKGVLTDKTMWYVSHINVIHERSLLAAAGNYDESRTFFIDWDMLQRLASRSKPYHLKKYTCEHYNYRNKASKNISLIHKDDPETSRLKHDEMFKRSFELLSGDDFVELVREHQSLLYQLEQLTARRDSFKDEEDLRTELEGAKRSIAELTQVMAGKDRRIEDLCNSLSWRVTRPLRRIYDLLSL